MTNYTKTTNFATKDTLPSGNANKIVKGTEIDTEFNNIATAVATKADTAGPTFTGTVTIPTVDLNGGAIDGTTVGASTAAAITGTTIVANTSINIAGDGATVTGIKDEDDMSSNSATKLATQQSIKAYVDSQVTAQDLDFQADTGGALSIDLDSETLTFTGGTGVDTSGSGNAVTFAIDSTVATLTGSQTLSNKTLATPVVSGNLTTNGLIDGRDVATDGTKLDGIESGATADQTAAEIKTAYESNADTNAFTDADHSKLDGIEASADVTDTANVTAAGALMDSELTDIAAVKALNQGVATSDSPTFAGLTTSADVSFGDNDKAIFGAGSDLEIFHEPNNSIIKESGGGSLLIQGDNIRLQKVDGTENMLTAVNDGQLKLFYDGSEKLATTSTGIDVTGTVTADGLTVSKASGDIATLEGTGTTADVEANLVFNPVYDVNARIVSAREGASLTSRLSLETGTANDFSTTERLRVSGNGDISFYEDTGTTPKFFWDSSAESLGIGTSSPSEKLTIAGDVQIGESSGGEKLKFVGASSKYNFLVGKQVNVDNALEITPSTAAGGNTFSTPAVVVNSSGNVGIGTNSPNAAADLHVADTSDTRIWIEATSGDTMELYAGTDVSVFNRSNNALKFGTNNAERMRIDASGNVGIGSSSTDGRLKVSAASGASAAGSITLYGNNGGGFGGSNVVRSKIESKTDGTAFGANMLFYTNDTSNAYQERMRIDSSGNVGIATNLPSEKFTVEGVIRANRVSSPTQYGDFAQDNQGGYISTHRPHASLYENFRFLASNNSGSVERMRIDTSGNLLVGGTSAFGADTITLGTGGFAGIRNTSGSCMELRRDSTDGSILDFQKDGTTVGSIGTTSGSLYIQGNPATGKSGLTFYGSYIEPRDNGAAADAAIDLGISSGRFKDIYRSGSTISTSDRNMKQDIRDLTDAERNVAVAAKGLLKAFRFIDTVAAEGDSANIHFGIIAQDLAAAFTAEGLDANDYQVYRADTFTDDDGNEQARLGICYENLLAFIISAI